MSYLNRNIFFLFVVSGIVANIFAMDNHVIDNNDMVDDETIENDDYSDYKDLCRENPYRSKEHGYTRLHHAADYNNPRCIGFLIENDKENVLATTSAGWTALHIATLQNNKKTVQKILECAQKNGQLRILVNMSDKNGMTALHLAVLHNRIDLIDMLIKNGADIAARTKRGSTVLYVAVVRNFLEVTRKLLEYRLHNDSNHDGNILLNVANKNNNLDMIRLLVQKGPYVHIMDSYGIGSLSIALRNNFMDVFKCYVSDIEKLPEKEMSQFIQGCNGDGLVHLIARHNNIDALKWLIEKYGKTILQLPDRNGLSALHVAAEQGCLEMIEFLVNTGSSISLCNAFFGYNILHYAALNGNAIQTVKKIFEIIRKKSLDPEQLIQELCSERVLEKAPIDFTEDPECKKLLTPKLIPSKKNEKKSNQKNNFKKNSKKKNNKKK